MLTLRNAIITPNHWRCANYHSVTIAPLVKTWRLLLSDVSSAHCDGFLTSCVQLLMGAHARKPFAGNKVWEMCIADDYKPHWDDLSELWFLGMQTLDACVSLFPSLAAVVLESRWLPGLIKLLLDVKGRGVPADVVTSYQGVLCSLAHCSLPARDVIQEKGGLQLARLYEMEELENMLNN